jgi:glyoxylase-like metal-dependent hydrolase (beta-lactamase superfamily II)
VPAQAIQQPQSAGVPEALSGRVRRLLAPNPSPYTGTGTQTYLVGRAELAVIDPGPADAEHLDAILAAAGNAPITAILCTHTHRDHSPAAAPLAARTGAAVIGCAPLDPQGLGPSAVSYDAGYRPCRVLADGERLHGPGWTLEAVATPGHTSNHLCYSLVEEAALFSGDHVMGWSTSVVIPPDGDMGAYMASLERLLGRGETVYYPGHSDPVLRPERTVRSMLGHRRLREAQILRLLGDGTEAVPDMVAAMYAGLGAPLRAAAGQSVLAHLVDLRSRGLVAEDGGAWRPAP